MRDSRAVHPFGSNTCEGALAPLCLPARGGDDGDDAACARQVRAILDTARARMTSPASARLGVGVSTGAGASAGPAICISPSSGLLPIMTGNAGDVATAAGAPASARDDGNLNLLKSAGRTRGFGGRVDASTVEGGSLRTTLPRPIFERTDPPLSAKSSTARVRNDGERRGLSKENVLVGAATCTAPTPGADAAKSERVDSERTEEAATGSVRAVTSAPAASAIIAESDAAGSDADAAPLIGLKKKRELACFATRSCSCGSGVAPLTWTSHGP